MVLAQLEVRAEIAPRWRGADLERLLDEDHAALIEVAAARLEHLGWSVSLEVTYSEYGERGSIDIVGLLPAARAALVIEAKTELGSAEAIGRKLDEKKRLAPKIVEGLAGWRPEAVGRALLLPETSRIRRTLEATPALRRMLPDEPRRLRAWLKSPSGSVAVIWFLPNISGRNPGRARRVSVRRNRTQTSPAAPREDRDHAA